MKDILHQIGLSDKEAALYLLLLSNPHQTAQQLADKTGIKRTNAYRLLDTLLEKGLVTSTDTNVKRFATADPNALQALLNKQQVQIKQTASSLSAVMPSFRSQYSLSLDKPGVIHMAGTDGFLRLLDDMKNSSTEVLLVASNDIPDDTETLKSFRKLQVERKKNGVTTRALFHNGLKNQYFKQKFDDYGLEVRFVGETAFKGEVALYESNTTFTVYDPSLVVTVITNAHITETMRTLFEQLWKTAKPE